MATKKARSSAKAVVTRKINEIVALMTDEGNVEEVNKKSGELLEAFDKFQAIHEAFHKELIDAESVRESEKFYQLVSGQVDLLLENLEIWLTGIEATRAVSSIEVRPEDSISNVGRRSRVLRSSHASRTSRSSHTSSVSARAKAAARKAVLEAEAATLKMLHEIEEEELKLRQRKNELKLKTELEKARAEEHAYAQVEIGANSPHASDQKRKLPPTPQLTEENLKDKVEGQNEPKEEFDKLPIQTKALNPEAAEWKNEYTRFPVMGNEATRSTPTADLQLLLLQQQEAIMALTLPQPELPVFTGDPIEYCDFIRAFENLVERKTSSSSARLYYLLQYTSGHVQDLVRSCLAMREDVGYSEARRLLAERYCQPFKIATAYVDRVIKGEIVPLTVCEIRDAEQVIIKHVQNQSFKEDMQTLKRVTQETQDKKIAVKKCSNIYKLDPFMENGFIRVGGRLHNAPIKIDAKHPIILPKKHHVVNLIIDYYHRASGHSGVEYTLSLLRQGYWIIGARSIVRNIINKCFNCRRRQAPVMQQKMASLPEDRITPSKPPFTYVGVDCFGPFLVRRGRATAKRYGVLFTCLAIRAVHIEVVHSMDTESFINALRRFISRRGRPEEIRSDNGGNFVKGEKELREALQQWNQAQIHDYLLQHDVKWIFNPPAASHHGGVWERCIRTLRICH